jgi:choline dehydrogenase
MPPALARSARVASAHVRLRDRRGRLGRLRACEPAHEDPDVSVLLIEAGGPDTNELVHLPAAFSALYRSAQDWDHSTIYEPYANDRRVYLPRGRVLGGSSSINALVYIRGNPLDYDGWGPAGRGRRCSLLQARRGQRARRERVPRGGGRCRCPRGARATRSPGLHRRGARRGLPANEDFNDGSQDGIGWYQVTERNGARCSTAVGYLHP